MKQTLMMYSCIIFTYIACDGKTASNVAKCDVFKSYLFHLNAMGGLSKWVSEMAYEMGSFDVRLYYLSFFCP